MITTITVLHLIVCFILILVILLQTGKGSEMGAVFGGSSQTVFGSGGAAPFLSKFTTGAAVVFMLTSLLLATLASRPGSSLMDDEVAAPLALPPAAPLSSEPTIPETEAPTAQTPAAPAQAVPAVPKTTEQAPASAAY